MRIVNTAFFVIVISQLLLSCSTSSEEEFIDINELLPKATYERKEVVVEEEVKEHSPLHHLISEMMPEFSFIDTNNEKSLFPDRFTFENRFHETYTFNNEHYFDLFHWTFKDSITTLSVFYNWLDCLGEACSSIRINEEIRLKSFPLFSIWVGKHELIHLQGNAPITLENWSKIADSTFQDEKWTYRMHQSSNKKLNWLETEEDEEEITL